MSHSPTPCCLLFPSLPSSAFAVPIRTNPGVWPYSKACPRPHCRSLPAPPILGIALVWGSLSLSRRTPSGGSASTRRTKRRERKPSPLTRSRSPSRVADWAAFRATALTMEVAGGTVMWRSTCCSAMTDSDCFPQEYFSVLEGRYSIATTT